MAGQPAGNIHVRESYWEMSQKALKIAITTNIVSSYREGFYDRLFSREDLFVKVYCQDRVPGLNVKSIHHKYPDNVQIVKYVSAKRDKLVWQCIPWTEIVSDYDLVFVSGNPRVLSDALLASLLKLFRRKVVLWTMAHSFRGNSVTENVRLLWSRIFDFLFVYTDAEVEYLRKKGFAKQYILGMNNGLDQKTIDTVASKWPEGRLQGWRIAHHFENRPLILSCARLEPKNRFEQVVQALPSIIKEIPNILWCAIGSGAEESNLRSIVAAAGLADHVHFVGELYDEEELAPWFLSSELLIHPAAIGLTILHAFGYGLPVVTHGSSELHNPEYTAFIPELTGRNFRKDDIENMAEAVVNLLCDSDTRSKMKNYTLRVAREQYNVDMMVERFVQIAHQASGV